MLLHVHGRLPEGYRYGIGGFDETLLFGIGLDHERLLAYIGAEKPGYLAFEAWVRAHAPKLSPADIAPINEHILTFVVPDERAAPRRAQYGVTDASVARGVALNDLDDWLGIHQQLIASH
jgi:hypothetical protein